MHSLRKHYTQQMTGLRLLTCNFTVPMPVTVELMHFVINMMNKSRFLAFSALGCLPVLAAAQTTPLPTPNVETESVADGPDGASIYWLAIPLNIAQSMYGPAQTITASVNVPNFPAGKPALLSAQLSASANIKNTPNSKPGSQGHLVPRTAPTWTSPTPPAPPQKQSAFGRTGNYGGLKKAVVLGNDPIDNADKFIGLSAVALDQLDLLGPDERRWSYKIVVADAESTNEVGEFFSAQFVGSGAWSQVAALPSLGGATSPKAPDVLTPPDSTRFQYSGGVPSPAYAQVMATQDPSKVTVTLAAGTSNHTSATSNTTTAQSMAIGVWPLVPAVTVTCSSSTPVNTVATCKVHVDNPPKQLFHIQLGGAPGNQGLDPQSTCLQSLSFNAGQTDLPQPCEIKISPTATTSVTNLAVAPSSPDNGGLTGWTTVNGTVNLAPPPKANDDKATTAQDTPLTIKPADLLGNDSNPNGDTLTITSVQGLDPSQGTVALVNGNIVFTPAAGYHGTAPFTYTISDLRGNTSTATVTVTVTPAPNQPPVAVDHAYSTPKDTPLPLTSAQLLDQSTDLDGDTLTVISVQDPVNGTVQMTGGNVTFTPTPGFVGTASFTYTISDGKGGTNTKTVTISVGTAAPAAATPVPVGGSGMLALITALMAGVAGWSLRNRRNR